MGNKCQNESRLIKKHKKDKYFTLCPLIHDRILLNEKKIVSNNVSCLGIIKYNNKDFILIGFYLGKIEIYDSETLDIVAEDHEEIGIIEYIRYVGQLLNEYFVVVSQTYVRIFAFYSDGLGYNIKLLQKISNPFESKVFHTEVLFSKAFYLDRNLYREYDIHERELDKKRRKKDKNSNYPVDEELIISSQKGIFIFESNKINEKEDNSNKVNKDDNSEKKNFDINSHLENWEKNPYTFREQIAKEDIYDMIQVNFKYLAGTIKDYLCLYSMETYELVTKFSVNISENCDSVTFMLKEDILCVAGNNAISLISIKDFEVLLVKIIKKKYKITEICILPDYNILIGVKKKSEVFSVGEVEYFYQYKCLHIVNKLTKKMEYSIIQVSSKFLTKNYSNITMRCLSHNRLVTIIDNTIIQVWN